MNIRRFIRPARTIPVTGWAASHPWELSTRRLLILFLGLTFLGLGGALIVESGLGNAPWTVFAQGISIQTGMSIGSAFFLTSCAVLLLWIPLAIKPGFGTLANATYFAIVLDIATRVIGSPSNRPTAFLMLFAGIILAGAGSAIYMSCGLGGGPRDGLLMGLIKRTGIRIVYIRSFMDGSALLLGYIFGGTIGIGTILAVLLASWSIAIAFNVLGQIPGGALPKGNLGPAI